MKTKLFKSNIFYYIFMFWVGLDLFNSLLQLNVNYSFISLKIIQYLAVMITLITFVSFFIDLKINHSIFKIYIYFRCSIMSLFFLGYALKDPIIYGVNSFEIFPLEFYFIMIFSLVFGLILLFFYRKYRTEYSHEDKLKTLD